MTKRIEDELLDELKRAGSVNGVDNDFVQFEGKIDLRMLAGTARRVMEDDVADKLKRFLQEA